jgi:nucleoside-diphosphate-sugar epimerase
MAAKEQLILLTGASGFVGGQILHDLLAEGYRVRCAVRSESSAASIRNIHSASSDQLTFATVTNFMDPDAFNDAVQGVSGIIHTASPFVLQSKDHENDLVNPAIQGTLHVLQATYKHASLQLSRVIVTSSFASILDMEKGYRPGYAYSEAD